MGWVTSKDYAAAAVDPLADEASSLIQEMNEQQTPTLLLLARVYGNVEAQQVTMTALDRLGFHLRIKTADRMQGGRVAFANPVRNASGGASRPRRYGGSGQTGSSSPAFAVAGG